MPPLSLVTKMTASGIPSTSAINYDTPTIRKFSITPCHKRSNAITDHLDVLCPVLGALAQFFRPH